MLLQVTCGAGAGADECTAVEQGLFGWRCGGCRLGYWLSGVNPGLGCSGFARATGKAKKRERCAKRYAVSVCHAEEALPRDCRIHYQYRMPMDSSRKLSLSCWFTCKPRQ